MGFSRQADKDDLSHLRRVPCRFSSPSYPSPPSASGGARHTDDPSLSPSVRSFASPSLVEHVVDDNQSDTEIQHGYAMNRRLRLPIRRIAILRAHASIIPHGPIFTSSNLNFAPDLPLVAGDSDSCGLYGKLMF